MIELLLFLLLLPGLFAAAAIAGFLVTALVAVILSIGVDSDE